MSQINNKNLDPKGPPSSPCLLKIPVLVWMLGCMMFLVNLSFIMVYSYVGIYMKSLGVTMGWIGVVEGVAEGCSYLMKLLSGMFSDYVRRRKPVMIVGYSMIVLSRFIFSLSTTFYPLFTARLVERIGNGIQSTPRDTMVADISPPNRIGAAYGLKRTLAQAGSLVGALGGIGAMIWAQGDYQKIFQIATIPAFIAFLILIFLIQEPRKFAHSALSSEIPLPQERKRSYLHWSNLSNLGFSFWLLMALAAVFMLSRFGETFLTLHAYTNFNLETKLAPTIMLVFNAGWCLSSYPVGVLADRMNRYLFLAMGIVFLILADHLLASATSLFWVYLGCFFWGVQYGVTQNIFLSLIVETVPSDLRGTGFGCYYIICAISAYGADHIAGHLSEKYGEAAAFSVSGVIAMVSLLFLILIVGYKKRKRKVHA
jgi:MFS family permease